MGLQRLQFHYLTHEANLSHSLFQRLYYLSKTQFTKLLNVLRSKLMRYQRTNASVGASLSVKTIVCVSLGLLYGSSYLDFLWPSRIAESTIYHVFNETLFALEAGLPQIHFHSTDEECISNSKKVLKLRNSPFDGFIAEVDGIAIENHRPSLRDVPDRRKYYNRERIFAICIQTAVQAGNKFRFVSACQATALYEFLNSDAPPEWATVVADEAYAHE